MSDVAPRHQTPDPRPKTTVPSPVPMCEHAHILISSSYPAILPSFHPLSAEVRTSVLGSLSPAWHFFHIPAFRASLRLWRDAAPQLALSLRLDLLLHLLFKCFLRFAFRFWRGAAPQLVLSLLSDLLSNLLLDFGSAQLHSLLLVSF